MSAPRDDDAFPPAPAAGRHRGRVLWRDPLVLTTTTGVEETPIGIAPRLSPLLPDRPVWYLLRLFWQVETQSKIAALLDARRRHAEAHPRHRLVVLANSVAEAWRLREAGIQAFLCNQNAFVDERRFVVRPEEKRFDAIYNARLGAYKRHELAREIPSLALIYDAVMETDRSRYRALRELLPQALFVNHAEAEAARAHLPSAQARLAAARIAEDGYAPPISVERVVTWLNRARVGLCLSRSEGAMFASIEYLLCGLPVVSTRSMGGRDLYFDPAHSRIVPDDAAAVAAAVAALASARLDPQEIRATALARIRHDRGIFVALVEELIAQSGGRPGFAEVFPGILEDGLFAPRTLAELAAEAAS